MIRKLCINLALIALTLALIVSVAALDVQARGALGDPSLPPAEGALGELAASGQFPLYPGDCMSFYPADGLPAAPASTSALPGDGYPLYPGDENWESMFVGNQIKETNRLFAVVPTDDGSLYVGGCFTDPYERGLNYIARLKNDVWQPLGTGMNEGVRAIAASGSDLYAGGFFTQAGGVPANNIARWDGSQWHALGTGLDGGVTAIVVDGTDVYAAGPFFNAGELHTRHVARWDGTQWHALGEGVQGGASMPFSLEMYNGQLYLGGWFDRVNYSTIYNIARWDGSQWLPVDGGLNSAVLALKAHGGSLYAAGLFTMGGSDPVGMRGVARWDGAHWSPVSADFTQDGMALAFLGNDLYLGNYYSEQGNGLTRYDGAQWSRLGSGLTSAGSEYLSLLPGYVNAAAAQGGRVYAVGTFDFAGNKHSSKIAVWHALPEAETLLGDEYSPGSVFYISAQYLTPGDPVTITVNGQPVSTGLQAASAPLVVDELGHVDFWLETSLQAQTGAYNVVLTAGGKSASTLFWVNPSAPPNAPFDPLPKVSLPGAVAPAHQQFLPGMRR